MFLEIPPSSVSTQVFPRIGDFSGQRAGSNRRWGGEKNLRLFMAHSSREIAVGRADALQGRIHAAKGIHWAAQASSAPGIFGHLDAGRDQDFPNRLVAPTRGLQIVND